MLFPDLLFLSTAREPKRVALRQRNTETRYAELAGQVRNAATCFAGLGLAPGARIAVWLPKTEVSVVAMLGAAAAGLSFVPINPVLKAAQTAHILRDSGATVLITQGPRWQSLCDHVPDMPALGQVLLTDEHQVNDGAIATQSWDTFLGASGRDSALVIDQDLAAILYTSGSTGKPKGVCLSHRNLVAGANSVAEYLGNTADDRLLAALPFSFDYGLSQLSTALRVGASVTLIDYLLPRDLLRALTRDAITGLAGVPPLWSQLAELAWPEPADLSLRYLTNSGGKLPLSVLNTLRTHAPAAQVFLMYGLTEAFRSTYLPPDELDQRPDSMGKAIPNAEVLVVRPDGSPCAADEPGELVHRGAHVALGYWNDPTRTAERFKPAPGQPPEIAQAEIAVWSGDTVRADAEGYLYFVGRDDEMIKSSGYRISPTEIEEVLYQSDAVTEAAVFGIEDERLGQRIIAVVAPELHEDDTAALHKHCRTQLAGFMLPAVIHTKARLPKNPNGKIDRNALLAEWSEK